MQGFEMKANARKLIRENAPKLFFITIIYLVIVTVMGELELRLPGTDTLYDKVVDRIAAGEVPGMYMLYSGIRLPGALLALLLLVLSPVVDAGYMSYCLKTARVQGGDYRTLLDGFLFFGKVMLISIVTYILVFLWTLLFIFPGIVAAYRYRQAYYILLDAPEKGALQCIRESKQMMAGHKLELFLIDLSFLGWYILDMIIGLILVFIVSLPISLPIVAVWLSPYMGLTRAIYYGQLVSRVGV